MKLLEGWQIREALEYAGGSQDKDYMERLTRALNYFNLSNNNLRCQWSYGTNGSFRHPRRGGRAPAHRQSRVPERALQQRRDALDKPAWTIHCGLQIGRGTVGKSSSAFAKIKEATVAKSNSGTVGKTQLGTVGKPDTTRALQETPAPLGSSRRSRKSKSKNLRWFLVKSKNQNPNKNRKPWSFTPTSRRLSPSGGNVQATPSPRLTRSWLTS